MKARHALEHKHKNKLNTNNGGSNNRAGSNHTNTKRLTILSPYFHYNKA